MLGPGTLVATPANPPCGNPVNSRTANTVRFNDRWWATGRIPYMGHRGFPIGQGGASVYTITTCKIKLRIERGIGVAKHELDIRELRKPEKHPTIFTMYAELLPTAEPACIRHAPHLRAGTASTLQAVAIIGGKPNPATTGLAGVHDR